MKLPINYILTLICIFCSLFSFGQNIRYVAPTVSGSGNGSNWANAMTLQNAINTAPNNSELRLRQGTYVVNSTLEIDRYRINLSIIGGYSGVGTTRDSNLYPTILDGRNRVQIMKIFLTNITIDGLNFINGFATGDDEGGAAILVWENNFRISNSTFKNNLSEGGRGAGAIYLKHGHNGNILIDNCVFENNRSNFKEYEFGQNGGGVIHNWSENVTIRNSKFKNNYTENWGGAIYTWGDNFVIENTEFENNISEKEGGAIYINHNGLTISNSIFLKNNSHTRGGAIYSNNSFSDYSQKIINSLFVENNANDMGGAIFSSLKIYITNSSFVKNSNTALIYPPFTSSESYPYQTSIYNSIFYQNSAKAGGYRADINSENTSRDESDKDIRRNIVQEYEIGTNNMIGVNPIFVNNTTDFRLQPTSPAVNAGNNALFNQVSPTTANTSRDLANNPRLFGTSIDYGAYELQQQPVVILQCTTIVLPANNATNVVIGTTISWNAVTTATGYRLTIGTTSGGNDVLNNIDVGNVTTYNLPNDLDYNTTYYVSIIPYNSTGDAQSCTQFSFTTEQQPIVIPQCTTMILPANNATNVAIGTNISWNAVTAVTGYRLTIGTTSGGNDVLNNVDVGNVITYNLPTDLDYNTTYYVSIIPYNSTGDAQSCTLFSFTTEQQPIVIPQCTTIVLPANNATNVVIGTNISWNNVTGATGYRLTMGTTSGGNDVLNNVDVGNVITYNLTNDLDYNTTYYVDIIPYNSTGDAQSCTQFSFTTEQQPCIPINAELIITGNTITINVLNNNPPFEYNLDNSGWVSNNIFNNLHYGLHHIEIKTNNNCRITLTFEILEMQNFISPNGDGINDELDFSFLRLKQNPNLLIVDRFGKTIFKDKGENNFIWKGKQSNGTTLPSNTYWYFIEWSELNSEAINKLQGWILLKNK